LVFTNGAGDSAKFDKNAILHHSIELIKNLLEQLRIEDVNGVCVCVHACVFFVFCALCVFVRACESEQEEQESEVLKSTSAGDKGSCLCV